jgi:hypothetical protein
MFPTYSNELIWTSTFHLPSNVGGPAVVRQSRFVSCHSTGIIGLMNFKIVSISWKGEIEIHCKENYLEDLNGHFNL